jgi:hypothetical protein
VEGEMEIEEIKVRKYIIFFSESFMTDFSTLYNVNHLKKMLTLLLIFGQHTTRRRCRQSSLRSSIR